MMVDEVQDRMGEEVDLWAHGENQLNSTQLNNLLFLVLQAQLLNICPQEKYLGTPPSLP